MSDNRIEELVLSISIVAAWTLGLCAAYIVGWNDGSRHRTQRHREAMQKLEEKLNRRF